MAFDADPQNQHEKFNLDKNIVVCFFSALKRNILRTGMRRKVK